MKLIKLEFSLMVALGTGVMFAAQTNVLTKAVVKTYTGDTVATETNVTRTVAKHEALKDKWKRCFKDIDTGLALRESRKGYRGGPWSPKWSTEAKAWFDQQDLSKLPRTFEFVDSVGFRHLMSFAARECSSRTSHDCRMEKTRIELEAKAAISRAWDADVKRETVDSKLETSNFVDRISSESHVSSGAHKGIVMVYEKDAEIGVKKCHVVVFGILPQCMKFK